MSRIAVETVSLTSASISSKEVSTGQTFKLAIGVVQEKAYYDFDDAPVSGYSVLGTSRRGQTNYALRKE